MKKLVLLASVCLLFTGHSVKSKNLPSDTNPFITAARLTALNDESAEPRTYKVKIGNGKDKKITIAMFNSGVHVIGHNSDEVVIQTNNFTPPPKQAEGLKPLYNQTEDNTQLGLNVTKDGNNLKISQASRHDHKYTIRVPNHVAITYHELKFSGKDFNLTDVDGEIEIKLQNGSAILTNVSGPVVANTTNGNLKIKFTKVEQNKPSAISSINGDVDITLPASTKANLKLRSINGEIYTDFDLNVKKDAKSDLPKIGGGNNIDGQINNGGVEMSINTINNDIFIRKNK